MVAWFVFHCEKCKLFNSNQYWLLLRDCICCFLWSHLLISYFKWETKRRSCLFWNEEQDPEVETLGLEKANNKVYLTRKLEKQGHNECHGSRREDIGVNSVIIGVKLKQNTTKIKDKQKTKAKRIPKHKLKWVRQPEHNHKRTNWESWYLIWTSIY